MTCYQYMRNKVNSMDENYKTVIYDSESFASLIEKINTHITNISNLFTIKFTLESYKGSKDEEIQLAITNILSSLENYMKNLSTITDMLSDYKLTYDDVISQNSKAVNGG